MTRVLLGTPTATTTYPNKYYNIATSTSSAVKHIFTPDGELVATILGSGATTTREYVHLDQLGDVNAITNATGTAISVTSYYPYGGTRVATGTPDQRGYISGEKDQSTGNEYLINRYYSNDRGQFMSEDPVFWEVGKTKDGKYILTNPQAANSYSYSEDNPIIKKDPSGRDSLQFNLSGTYFIFSASVGIGIDRQGIVGSISGGPALGLSAYVQGSYSTSDLNHRVELNVSRSVEFAVGAGIGMTRQGTYDYDPSNPSSAVSLGRNQKNSFSVLAGLGGGVSQQYSWSIPLVSFGSQQQSTTKPTNSQQSYTTKLYTTPNGTAVNWNGNIVSPAPKSNTSKSP